MAQQEIEIEFKNMVSRDDFNKLCHAFGILSSDFITQENFYFETPSFSLKEQKSALRIRLKEGKYVLTLKQPYIIGKLETHQQIAEAEAQKMIREGSIVDGEIKNILLQNQIITDDILFLGTLVTNRAEMKYDNDLLVFDHSLYFNKEDYEIEYETANESSGHKKFLNILNEYDIPIQKANSKIMRFYLESKKL